MRLFDVPIPSEADEEARRAHREREDLIGSRRSILNKIDGILATLGITDFRALRRDRRKQLADLRQPDGEPIPKMAQTRIERLPERLELVVGQVKTVEEARDAIIAKPAADDDNERMNRDLAAMRGIGAQSATLLVREVCAQEFANRQALGAYAGLCGTPFGSGGMQREQGIGKDANRRLRALMVEIAWFWLRFQPDGALTKWFRERVGQAKGRMSKVTIVALARKLLIALWRYAKEGVIPEGAAMKAVRRSHRRSRFRPKAGRRHRFPRTLNRGRRFIEWRRRTELLARIPGSWFGIATSHRIRGWQGAPAETNRSSPQAGKKERS